MKYLLDTTLLIELAHAAEEDWISRWVDAFDEDSVYISILTIGELSRGIEAEPDPQRKQALQTWLDDDLLVRFHGKIVPLDLEVMAEWGGLTVQLTETEHQLSAVESLIAATVKAKKMVLITYDREIYTAAGIDASDPWQG